ncbi:MAG: hypothetical protein H6712_04860 [Myxococcales bacterium]|nr:hypothetical protein [Myxococcales bacterium]MCB9713161.1 hypothetical protein [Myxococcales bacterium]
MNLSAARIVLRPRTPGETLDLALRWQLAVGGRCYAHLALVLLLPAALGCYALQREADWSWGQVWALAVALAIVLQGPFTVAASRLMFETEVGAGSVLLDVLRRLPTYLAALVGGAVYVAASGIVVLPLPWTLSQVAFLPEAVLLERHGISDALARARRFAFGHYDVLFRVLLAQGVAFVGGAVLADQLGGALLDFGLQLGRPFGALFEGGSLSALLGLFAAVPFVASARFLQYIDGRTRRDGWDIQLAFLALGPDETEGTP